MTDKHFDINRLVVGMKVVNREKDELKLIFQFLCPYLVDLGRRTLVDSGEMLASNTYPYKEIEVLSAVSSKEPAWLKFTAQKTYHGFAVNLLYGYGAADQHTLLWKDSDEKAALNIEGLSILSTDICRNDLFPRLVAKMIAMSPLNDQQLARTVDGFFAAAARE